MTLRRKRQAGFALVDALVSLAIFAVMTGLLFQTVSSTVLAKRHVRDGRDAILIAQSALAELQNSAQPNRLNLAGASGDFQWRADISPYSGESVDNSRGLETVTVTVTKRPSRRVVATLKTLRLAR